MFLAHKIRIYPTKTQANKLNQLFGTARFVYNCGLARWKEEYELGQNPNVYTLMKEFTKIRKVEFTWSRKVSRCAYNDGLFRLDEAYTRFFKKQNKYPKFKKKHGKQSCELDNEAFYIKEKKVRLPRIGFVKLAEDLRYAGKILKGTLSKKANQYFISITVEVANPVIPRQPDFENQAIGVDMGVKDFVTLSDGTKFENKHFLKSVEKRIRRKNKSLSRKVLGSNNWKKDKLKLQVEYLRITNKRKDYLHKLSTGLCKKYWLIAIEDLNVAGMVKNRKLSKAISELGIGEFFRQLEYKSAIYQSEVVKVGRFFPSSKTCSDCGEINHSLTLADREWVCPNCSTTHDRDFNASMNILIEGIRLKYSTASSAGTCS